MKTICLHKLRSMPTNALWMQRKLILRELESGKTAGKHNMLLDLMGVMNERK